MSTEIIAIPSTSTHDSPKLSIYGKINTWLKFLDNGMIRADNVLMLGSSDETDIGFDDSTFRNRIVASSAGVKMWGDFNLYNGSKNAVQVTRDGVRATQHTSLQKTMSAILARVKLVTTKQYEWTLTRSF